MRDTRLTPSVETCDHQSWRERAQQRLRLSLEFVARERAGRADVSLAPIANLVAVGCDPELKGSRCVAHGFLCVSPSHPKE